MGFIVQRRITATSRNMVSISFDRIGEDALMPKYDGEGVSFTYHRAAQVAARRIAGLWQQDAPHLQVELE